MSGWVWSLTHIRSRCITITRTSTDGCVHSVYTHDRGLWPRIPCTCLLPHVYHLLDANTELMRDLGEVL